MVPFAVLGAGVALEADSNERPLVVLPAVEFVEMSACPAVLAFATFDNLRFNGVFHVSLFHSDNSHYYTRHVDNVNMLGALTSHGVGRRVS
jgi:hypothetical protein